jgi:mycothiol synthase
LCHGPRTQAIPDADFDQFRWMIDKAHRLAAETTRKSLREGFQSASDAMTKNGTLECVAVEIADAPPIEGLTFRRLEGNPDFEEIAEVMQKSRDADRYEMVDTPNDVAEDFHHLQNCDPYRDILYVRIDEKLIGMCRCEWHSRPQGVRTYEHMAYLVPQWRVKDLRKVMLRENERRLREIASSHPEDCQRFIETRTNGIQNPWKSLLEQEGYVPFRHNMQMVRPVADRIPTLPMPEGLEIRPFQPEHLSIIWNAGREAFLDEPNFTEEMWTEEALRSFSRWRAFTPRLWQVAWDGDAVAGAAINAVDHEENRKYGRNWGYAIAIFVRKPYRIRGLASALLARSISVLKEEGVDAATLVVDSDNPSGAHRLYERMGFRKFDDYVRYRKPMD